MVCTAANLEKSFYFCENECYGQGNEIYRTRDKVFFLLFDSAHHHIVGAGACARGGRQYRDNVQERLQLLVADRLDVCSGCCGVPRLRFREEGGGHSGGICRDTKRRD